VGTILEQEWSSLITPAKKAELMDRSEQLIRAVQKARSRANEQTIEDPKGTAVGAAIYGWLFKPLQEK
jgi:hypothetical protein